MFDPRGNSENTDVSTEEDCYDQNDNYQSILPLCSSSTPDNNDDSNRSSKKRKLSYSQDYGTKEQYQTNIASTLELEQMQPPASMIFNNDQNILQGARTYDNLARNASAFASGPISPLFQSAFRRHEDFSTLPPPTPSNLDDIIGMSSSNQLGDVKYNRFPPSRETSVALSKDPLQDLLQNFASSEGNGSTFNGIARHHNLTSTRNNKIDDLDSAAQFSLYLNQQRHQQQSEIFLRSIPNNEFLAPDATALINLGDTSLESNSNVNYDKELKFSNSEALRNLQLQQQRVDHTTALARLFDIDNRIPLQAPSNSVSIHQALISNNLNHFSADAGTTSNSLPHNQIQSSKISYTTERRDIRKSDALDDTKVYDCDRGRSKPLFLPCDAQTLSEYQCLLRNQIELFEATEDDIKSNTKGRNKPIFLGQVGVRCVHCRNIKPECRARGATYYPASLGAMYQSGQTMAIRHLRHHCTRIPSHIRERLFVLKDGKSSAGGGKKYWSDAASVMGVYVCKEGGLRFRDSSSSSTTKAAAAPPSNDSDSKSEDAII